MIDDLQERLERLAAELTGDPLVPPPAAARRRGRRRRQRQVAGAVLLSLALAGVAVGGGLLDRDPPAGSVRPSATTTRPKPQPQLRPLAPPRVKPGELAVIVQDPPIGLPRELHGGVDSCKEVKTGKFTEFSVTLAPPRRLKLVGWQVVPLPPSFKPGYAGPKGPWATGQVYPPDLKDVELQPYLLAEARDGRIHLRKKDGTIGTFVAPYRVVQPVEGTPGHVTGTRTLQASTGAQVAIAWNCGTLQDRAPWIMGAR